MSQSTVLSFYGGDVGSGGIDPDDLKKLIIRSYGPNGSLTAKHEYDPTVGLEFTNKTLRFSKFGVTQQFYNPDAAANIDLTGACACVVTLNNSSDPDQLQDAADKIHYALDAGVVPILKYQSHYYYYMYGAGGYQFEGNITDTGFEHINLTASSFVFTAKTFKADVVCDATDIDFDNPDPDKCAAIVTKIGNILASGHVPVLKVTGTGYNPVYAMYQSTAAGAHVFIGNFNTEGFNHYQILATGAVSTKIKYQTARTFSEMPMPGGSEWFFDTVNHQYVDYTPQLSNYNSYVMRDWSGTWADFDEIRFHTNLSASETKDIDIYLINCDIHDDTGTWLIKIYDCDGVAIPCALNTARTANLVNSLQAGGSYVIHISNGKWYAEEYISVDPADIVTPQEMQDAIDTLKSRTVFSLDVGGISGMQLDAPNGNGFLGTLFSPVMDFDLSTSTNVVFDVEQTSSNISDMENFVIAIYEFDRGDPDNSIPPSFKWVCNTDDIAAELYNNANPTTGLKHTSLTHIRNTNKKLYGGKLYYALFAGKWNAAWGFAGNTAPNNMHSSIMVAPKCTNRSFAIGPNIGTTYPSIALTNPGTNDEFFTETQGGCRMFIALTNSQLGS